MTYDTKTIFASASERSPPQCAASAVCLTLIFAISGLCLAESGVNTRASGKIDRSTGNNHVMGDAQIRKYRLLKNFSPVPKKSVDWGVTSLGSRKFIDGSGGVDRIYYGASMSKMFLAAAVLDKHKGSPGRKTLSKLIRLLVISDNDAWRNLTMNLGGGNHLKSNKRLWQFTREMGTVKSLPFIGWLGEKHGNEINVRDINTFLSSAYNDKFRGSDLFWNKMWRVRTGKNRGRKYLPSHLAVGGKTGTWEGPVFLNEFRDKVHQDVRHHSVVVERSGEAYVITVLSDGFTDDDVGILVGGLYREYILGLHNFRG